MLDSQEKLDQYLPALRAATWVAVDTEADSLHAYPEKLCLIQISTAHGDQLIDTLAKLDLGPLLAAIAQHELIVHGADYDLRMLSRHHKFVPVAIFDTMLAARLLGLTQFGLGSLVEKYLGVKLEKGPQKANWAIRPLTPRMEAYARNDTRYLRPLEDRLRAELKEKQRLAWHKEACARLIRDCTTGTKEDAESAWRLKGSRTLNRLGLAVLREAWKWREREAVAANRPPFFIMSHDALLRIADAASNSRPIEAITPRGLSDRRREGLLKAVSRGLELPQSLLPKLLRNNSRRPSEGEKKRYLELRRRRDARAAELGLDPTIIASRGVLSELAYDWETHCRELMKWQRDLLAE